MLNLNSNGVYFIKAKDMVNFEYDVDDDIHYSLEVPYKLFRQTLGNRSMDSFTVADFHHFPNYLDIYINGELEIDDNEAKDKELNKSPIVLEMRELIHKLDRKDQRYLVENAEFFLL